MEGWDAELQIVNSRRGVGVADEIRLGGKSWDGTKKDDGLTDAPRWNWHLSAGDLKSELRNGVGEFVVSCSVTDSHY